MISGMYQVCILKIYRTALSHVCQDNFITYELVNAGASGEYETFQR